MLVLTDLWNLEPTELHWLASLWSYMDPKWTVSFVSAPSILCESSISLSCDTQNWGKKPTQGSSSQLLFAQFPGIGKDPTSHLSAPPQPEPAMLLCIGQKPVFLPFLSDQLHTCPVKIKKLPNAISLCQIL